MAFGGTHQPKDPNAQAAALERAAQLREYSPEEFDDILEEQDILLANRYQLETPLEALLQTPLPPELTKRNPLGAAALTGNVIDYDTIAPGVEDLIAEDEKIQVILKQENSGDRGPLLRARRSILGYLALKDLVEQSDVA